MVCEVAPGVTGRNMTLHRFIKRFTVQYADTELQKYYLKAKSSAWFYNDPKEGEDYHAASKFDVPSCHLCKEVMERVDIIKDIHCRCSDECSKIPLKCAFYFYCETCRIDYNPDHL